MTFFQIILLITIIILGTFAAGEIFAPRLTLEGFSAMASAIPKDTYWSRFAAPRADVGPTSEDQSYIRDPRYFNGYADVSRIGASYDFCRMISPVDDPKNKFFACALAGTENLSSTKFRTLDTANGFKTSVDDYMRDTTGTGREDYCRILKYTDASYQPLCLRSQDFGFDSRDKVDPNPPSEVATLLTFYQGCVIWLRFFGDMLDYVDNVKVQTAGSIAIDENIKDVTAGLPFYGGSQFLRISDSSDLSLGTEVPLRSLRTWMVWVYFNQFTNNAKIFDFGNGKSADNVFLGILAKGDQQVSDGNGSTVPTGPSGQQAVAEMPPQVLMATSDANVNEYICPGNEVMPRKLPPSTLPTISPTGSSATLLYEVWDKQSRKMRLKLNSAIPLKTWTHIVITTTTEDNIRPNMAVYINGDKVLEKDSGFLPSTGNMTNCYIGKSNWNSTQYANRDEGFVGSLFDFRAYRTSASEQLISDSYTWGKEKLGLN